MDVQLTRIDTQDPFPSIKTVAIIPAGGIGRRMQGNAAKQYLLLAGVPLLVHTVKRFQVSPAIDAVYLIVPQDDVEGVRRSIVDPHGLTKVTKILAGGRERQDSVKNGIEALENDTDVVLVHDAVRPFICQELIRQSVREAAQSGAVVVAVPVKETVKICDEKNQVTQTPDRKSVWLAQTPQAFRRDIIVQAYEAARRDAFYGTDDASLVERIGVRVNVIPGTYENIKITTPEDFVMAEALLAKEDWSS